MKVKLAVLLAVLWSVGPALGGFDVPKGVHRIKDLDKAKAEAKAQKKPITILYTNAEGT